MSQLARAEVAHSTLTPDAMLSWAAPLIVILAASALVWASPLPLLALLQSVLEKPW